MWIASTVVAGLGNSSLISVPFLEATDYLQLHPNGNIRYHVTEIGPNRMNIDRFEKRHSYWSQCIIWCLLGLAFSLFVNIPFYVVTLLNLKKKDKRDNEIPPKYEDTTAFVHNPLLSTSSTENESGGHSVERSAIECEGSVRAPDELAGRGEEPVSAC